MEPPADTLLASHRSVTTWTELRLFHNFPTNYTFKKLHTLSTTSLLYFIVSTVSKILSNLLFARQQHFDLRGAPSFIRIDFIIGPFQIGRRAGQLCVETFRCSKYLAVRLPVLNSCGGIIFEYWETFAIEQQHLETNLLLD